MWVKVEVCIKTAPKTLFAWLPSAACSDLISRAACSTAFPPCRVGGVLLSFPQNGLPSSPTQPAWRLLPVHLSLKCPLVRGLSRTPKLKQIPPYLITLKFHLFFFFF